MKKLLLGAAVVLSSISAVHAKDVTVTFSDDEQRALVQLLDITVKSGGLGVADAALHFVKKMKPDEGVTPEVKSGAPSAKPPSATPPAAIPKGEDQ